MARAATTSDVYNAIAEPKRRAIFELLYSAKPAALQPVGTWVKKYERYWERQLDQIKERAERHRTARKKH